MITKVSKIIGSSDLTIETGKLARLADGSVTVRSGETLILVAAVSATSVKEGQDWFPLTVDWKRRQPWGNSLADISKEKAVPPKRRH
jgi:polyribonucleotide nucleotidyltransferase